MGIWLLLRWHLLKAARKKSLVKRCRHLLCFALTNICTHTQTLTRLQVCSRRKPFSCKHRCKNFKNHSPENETSLVCCFFFKGFNELPCLSPEQGWLTAQHTPSPLSPFCKQCTVKNCLYCIEVSGNVISMMVPSIKYIIPVLLVILYSIVVWMAVLQNF